MTDRIEISAEWLRLKLGLKPTDQMRLGLPCGAPSEEDKDVVLIVYVDAGTPRGDE